MNKSYYNQLALERTGEDLPTILRRIGSDEPNTAVNVSEEITALLGEPYRVRCVRYLSKIAQVPLKFDRNPLKNRGRGYLQRTLVHYLTHDLKRVGIEATDYDHIVFMMVYCYLPEQVHLGNLVRLIGFKAYLPKASVKNMYNWFFADVQVEQFFIFGRTRLTRGVLRKMASNTKQAHASVQGRRIKSVVSINENSTLMVFDDGMGILIRPDTRLGNVMRIESRERVQSHLQTCIQQGESTISEVSDLLVSMNG